METMMSKSVKMAKHGGAMLVGMMALLVPETLAAAVTDAAPAMDFTGHWAGYASIAIFAAANQRWGSPINSSLRAIADLATVLFARDPRPFSR